MTEPEKAADELQTIRCSSGENQQETHADQSFPAQLPASLLIGGEPVRMRSVRFTYDSREFWGNSRFGLSVP